MHEDPVKEFREAGRVLAERAGNDLHVFFEQLRESQKQYAYRIVDTVRSDRTRDKQRLVERSRPMP